MFLQQPAAGPLGSGGSPCCLPQSVGVFDLVHTWSGPRAGRCSLLSSHSTEASVAGGVGWFLSGTCTAFAPVAGCFPLLVDCCAGGGMLFFFEVAASV